MSIPPRELERRRQLLLKDLLISRQTGAPADPTIIEPIDQYLAGELSTTQFLDKVKSFLTLDRFKVELDE